MCQAHNTTPALNPLSAAGPFESRQNGPWLKIQLYMRGKHEQQVTMAADAGPLSTVAFVAPRLCATLCVEESLNNYERDGVGFTQHKTGEPIGALTDIS